MGCKRVPSNDESTENNDYSLQLSRWFLISIGAWPQTRKSTLMERLSAFVLIPIFWATVAINAIPCLLYVFFETEDIQTKLNTAGPLIHRLMGTVNYWTLLSRTGDMRDCIDHMETDWRLVRRAEDRELMIQYSKFGRFITVICAVFMQSAALLFSATKVMKKITVVIDNQTITMHPMTCPAYRKLIDARFSPTNEIMLTIQFASTYVTSASTVCVCSLAAVFAMHACGQLNVLYEWLNELTEKHDEGDLAEKKLTVVVEHHLRVLSFIARIESIMHKACLVELMGCTINMCLVGYYALMNWAEIDATKIILYIIVYLSMSFNILIFCYIGEILTEQCRNVGDMAYMTNWYKLRHKTALGLVLIIARSSNVIKITAGKLFHLSITTFGEVVKTSVVYLNILRTVAM
ncbi:PREDICTED: odorant receptor 82a-like [Dinoponera quadriceps]|uniref:Odorant receptor n=1 Tax=Dinoponera quadriceps TaxID=609295 RepID=A0A6P3X9S5_DINQU|nr:PREDICTED: odorant receptor 82a-like [Dinoponera quadriceps]